MRSATVSRLKSMIGLAILSTLNQGGRLARAAEGVRHGGWYLQGTGTSMSQRVSLAWVVPPHDAHEVQPAPLAGPAGELHGAGLEALQGEPHLPVRVAQVEQRPGLVQEDAVVADGLDHPERLAREPAEPAPELLEPEDAGHGGPEHEDGVDQNSAMKSA